MTRILHLWKTRSVSYMYRARFWTQFVSKPNYFSLAVLGQEESNLSRGTEALDHLEHEQHELYLWMKKKASPKLLQELFEAFGIDSHSKRRKLRTLELLWDSLAMASISCRVTLEGLGSSDSQISVRLGLVRLEALSGVLGSALRAVYVQV